MKHQISTPDLTALFDSLSAGFIYFSPDAVIGYCNDTAASLFGATPSRMTGTRLTEYGLEFLSEQGTVTDPGKNPILLAAKANTSQLDRLFHIRLRSKKEVWLRCNIEPIFDVANDSAAGAVLSFVEVTDAVLAKKEREENEQKYQHHFMFSEGATFLATKDGRYLGVSKGAETLFGYTSEELKKIGRKGILIEDENFKKAVKERDKNGKAITEVNGRRKDGTIIPVLWYASLFTTNSGDELVSVVMIDLSEKKQLEKSAETLDYNLQLILDNTDETFVLVDEKLRVLTFNKMAVTAFAEIHGKQLQAGRNIIQLFNKIHQKELEEILSEVLNGASRDLQRVYHLPQGKLKAYQTTFRPLYKQEKVIGIIINSRDITKKYKIQQELLASHERYKRAAQASYDILWEHDLHGHQMYFSDSFAQAFDYTENITMLPAEEFAERFLHPHDREMIITAVTEFIKSGNTHFTYPIHRLLKKDGSFIYAEAQVIASRDEKGEAYLLTGVTRDITERHLMEQQLKESNERYDLVSKATSDIVWDWDIKTNHNWMSENFAAQFGYHLAGSDLKHWEEKIHPEDKHRILHSLKQAIEKGRSHWQAEYRFLKADGTYANVYDRGYALYDKDRKPYRMIGAMQNITELKHLQQKITEEQLAVQKKITEAAIRSQETEREELGKELHDNINQILATCKMLIDISIKNKEQRDDFLPKSFEYLNKAIEEIRLLSKSLVPPSLGEIGLSEAIEDLTHSYTQSVTTAIYVEGDVVAKESIANDIQLMAYRIVQEQLNNIMKYAKATEIRITLAIRQNNLHVTVADNGVGFNPAEKKNGIGFKNMKSRAAFYGGCMQIQSSPGKGCVLEVYIPVKQNRAAVV